MEGTHVTPTEHSAIAPITLAALTAAAAACDAVGTPSADCDARRVAGAAASSGVGGGGRWEAGVALATLVLRPSIDSR